MKDYLTRMRFSAWHVAVPEEKSGERTEPCASTNLKFEHVAAHSKYSDKYEDAAESLPSITSQKDRMNPEFFPPSLWNGFFEKGDKAKVKAGKLACYAA